MKKSDLPWIIPLLTAFSEGKVIQVRHGIVWVDWTQRSSVPVFDGPGGAADYRIKPELKTPFQVYAEAAYPEYKSKWSEVMRIPMTRGINAVICAYKNGELDLTGVNL